MPPQGGGFPGMGGFPEGMSPEERMKEHAEKMQKEQEKREKKIRKILTEEQYATWQTVKPQPQGTNDVRLYGGCPFPVLEVFQVHQHPLFQLFISEAFPKSGALERRADHLAGIIRGRIDNTGIWCTVVFSPDLFRLDVER